MSGIVGILNLDNGPVEPFLLQRLTDFLSFRGPDAQDTWLSGQIGFGFTLSATTAEDLNVPLFGRHEKLRVIADARLDGREDLIAALQSHSLGPLGDATDAELILHAYQVWGVKCVDHLMGDFSFAIWDAPHRRLFCARDQIGVKPFFYARVGPLLIFSNTLDCIRRHPAVSHRLNDLSIADFLLFEMIHDPQATAFAEIQRLPPAHVLLCEDQRLTIRRYWEPPASPRIHYQHAADYVDHFNELLDKAVADRLRSESACIFMSGGLDSPAVAASAARVARRNSGVPSLWAYTQVFDSLIPHEERHYAGLVADALKIPIEYRADDDLRLFQFARQPDYHSPEPVHTAWPDVTVDQLRRVSNISRVVLTGYGADPLFSSHITMHFRDLIRQRRFGRALADAAGYLTAEGRMSRLYLRTRWRLLLSSKKAELGFFPEWLNQDLVRKLGLRDHWESLSAEAGAAAPHGAVRPEGYKFTFSPFWPDVFNAHDPGVTGVPVEVRNPFFDLRLVNYLLGLPRLPWCCDKQLLREASRNVLPDAVRLRRKSPLQAEPLLKLLQRPDAAEINRFESSPELSPYVTRNLMPQPIDTTDLTVAWVHLRPLSLNYWLRAISRPRIHNIGGAKHEHSPAGRFS